MDPLAYIYSYALYGRRDNFKPGLMRIKHLLKQANNPHLNFPIIHIAGTNGKGSTAAFVDFVLREKKMKVGRFTSPHLTYYGERITINGELMPLAEITVQVEKWRKLWESLPPEMGDLTFFEITTFIALNYFAQMKVDIAILEVGMGGRLDATNCVQPIITAITSIDLEHTQFLGDTLEQIAQEKAGIIKEQIPVICGAEGLALQTIKAIAQQKKAPFFARLEHCQWQIIDSSISGQSFSLRVFEEFFSNLEISLLGEYQVDNCVLAIMILKKLPLDLRPTALEIRRGIKKARWPGRLELFQKNNLILLDGAHNDAAAKLLFAFLKQHFSQNKIVFIISLIKGKSLNKILEEVKDFQSSIIVTKSNNQRSADPEELINEATTNLKLDKASDLESALAKAYQQSDSTTLICIFGSLYLVGHARNMFEKEGYSLFNN